MWFSVRLIRRGRLWWWSRHMKWINVNLHDADGANAQHKMQTTSMTMKMIAPTYISIKLQRYVITYIWRWYIAIMIPGQSSVYKTLYRTKDSLYWQLYKPRDLQIRCFGHQMIMNWLQLCLITNQPWNFLQKRWKIVYLHRLQLPWVTIAMKEQ